MITVIEISPFILGWTNTARILGTSLIGLSVFILIMYFLRVLMISSRSGKYNFINAHEIRTFKIISVICLAGLALVFNSFIEGLFRSGDKFEFFMGLFIAGIFGVAVGHFILIYLNYYYPSVLEKRLVTIRFKPRQSESGKEMRLLNEEEEDIHLTPEMIADENAFEFEYDVWVDDDSGSKLIEKYDSHTHYLLCDNCKFRTLLEYKEEIIKEPTEHSTGLVEKYYKCSYCNAHELRKEKIGTLEIRELKHESAAN